jgi:hypothetical protein
MQAFLKKIEAERALLRLVNNYDGFPELTGASLAAVDEWRAQSVPKDIANDVLKISNIISALAERSGERFDERHQMESSHVRAIMNSLSHKLVRRKDQQSRGAEGASAAAMGERRCLTVVPPYPTAQ